MRCANEDNLNEILLPSPCRIPSRKRQEDYCWHILESVLHNVHVCIQFLFGFVLFKTISGFFNYLAPKYGTYHGNANGY